MEGTVYEGKRFAGKRVTKFFLGTLFYKGGGGCSFGNFEIFRS